MKVRRFGALVLLVAGVLPLGTAGYVMLRRAERTALDDVRLGNGRAAVRATSRLKAYVDTQIELLRALGISFAPAVTATAVQKERILKGYRLVFPNLRQLDVVGHGPGCVELGTSRLDGRVRPRCGEPAVDASLAGRVYLGEVSLSEDFAPLMTMGVPVEIAGESLGAVVAEIDLVGIWEAVEEVRVGKDGYARLVTRDGTLIAHGNPEERRRVFLHERDRFAERIREGGTGGARYRDSQGRDVIALAATVPELGWTVIVEQPESEAFGAARLMRRDMAIVLAVAATVAVVLGVLLGGVPVRAIEAMKQQVRAVARGDLEARVAPPHLEELHLLAEALNEMAAELARLQEDIKAKERLSTFALVAAGLAHDLKEPIQRVRAACEEALAFPDEEEAIALLASAAKNHVPRLEQYMHDLVRLAREGSVAIEVESLDVRALAEQAVREAGASRKWERVEFAVEGRVERVWANKSLLVRALGNLVGNAADACLEREVPGGRVVVRVTDHDEGETLVIAVSDTGVGISPAALKQLFLQNFKSTKRTSGIGLGLAVVRHVAMAHDADLDAESSPGVGSTFRIRLPRRAVAGVSAAEGAKGPHQEKTA